MCSGGVSKRSLSGVLLTLMSARTLNQVSKFSSAPSEMCGQIERAQPLGELPEFIKICRQIVVLNIKKFSKVLKIILLKIIENLYG